MTVWHAVAKIAGKPLFRLLAERHHVQANPRVFVYAAGGYYYPGKGNDALRTEMIVDGMVKPLQMELDWNRDYGITRATFSIGQRATSIRNGAGNAPAPFIDSRAYA